MSYPHRLLELLAADASRERLEQAARDAGLVDGASSPADAAQIRAATELARRVRTTLDQRRRRETELAALVETARDLAVLRDLDAVLVAIVRRARALLGTDTTYLTLADPDRGDTYMRVTDGSVSARFQRLRLPPGAASAGSSRSPARRTPPPTTCTTNASSTPPRSIPGCWRRAWWPSSAYHWRWVMGAR